MRCFLRLRKVIVLPTLGDWYVPVTLGPAISNGLSVNLELRHELRVPRSSERVLIWSGDTCQRHPFHTDGALFAPREERLLRVQFIILGV